MLKVFPLPVGTAVPYPGKPGHWGVVQAVAHDPADGTPHPDGVRCGADPKYLFQRGGGVLGPVVDTWLTHAELSAAATAEVDRLTRKLETAPPEMRWAIETDLRYAREAARELGLVEM